MKKSVIFVADSLDNAHKFQQVLSALDVEVAAGSSLRIPRRNKCRYSGKKTPRGKNLKKYSGRLRMSARNSGVPACARQISPFATFFRRTIYLQVRSQNIPEAIKNNLIPQYLAFSNIKNSGGFAYFYCKYPLNMLLSLVIYETYGRHNFKTFKNPQSQKAFGVSVNVGRKRSEAARLHNRKPQANSVVRAVAFRQA